MERISIAKLDDPEALLERLRDEDTLNSGATDRGLQSLLRRFLIRNTKSQNERRYFLVDREADGFDSTEFHKLDDDLQQRVRNSSLIPFEGEHALFYLELREFIQEVTERHRDGEASRTFIPTDLRQGLSSYRQIATSKLLNRDVDSAKRLRALVDCWNKEGKLHPKVAALVAVVRDIVTAEIDRVREASHAWFSKVLIFNKLIRGTAPQLTEALGELLRGELDGYLAELLASRQTNRDDVRSKVRRHVDEQLQGAERELKGKPEFSAWRRVPEEFTHEDFVVHRGQSLLRVFREPLRRRAVQSLALIDLLRSCPTLDDKQVGMWVKREITGEAIQTVHDVINRYLDDSPTMMLPARLCSITRNVI